MALCALTVTVARGGAIKILSPALSGAVRFSSATSATPDDLSCDLLVVGAGTAGCAIAHKFSPKVKTIVLDASEVHYYQPMFTLVGGGLKTFDQTIRPTACVLPESCQWVQDKAIKFSPESNSVTTHKGDTIKYKYLVMAAGVQLNFDKIKGLEKALKEDPMVCSNYSPVYVRKTWPAIQSFTHGNAIFTFPNSPVKCAGAPQKICYLAEDYFTRSGKRNKANMIYTTTLPQIFGVPYYAKFLQKIADSRNITVHKRTNLIEVNHHTKEVVFENLDEPGKTFKTKYSLLHAVPPMTSPKELWGSPLVDASNFVEVNKDTLQHVKYGNVFAIGDCSNAPTIRTAAAVSAQAGVVERNLNLVMEGKKPDKVYDGYTSCPLTIRHNQVMLAEFGYDFKILETFPVDQSIPRYTMYLMKARMFPDLYWRLLVKGFWNGPAMFRKAFRLGMSS